MSDPAPEAPADHPCAAEIEDERRGWYELAALVRTLTPAECLLPGYQLDPDWTVAPSVRPVRPRSGSRSP